MDFLIRDDDICFLTTPKDLEDAWGWYLKDDFAKLNLSVIPFVDPSVFGSPEINLKPIDENKDLVDYLVNKIKERKVEILLHGFSHAYFKTGFEFEGHNIDELTENIKRGREYLEDIFHQKINVFVPPHNTLSKEGLEAVRRNKLNILAAMPFSPFRFGLSYEKLEFFIKRRRFSHKYKNYLKGKYVYPFIVEFTTHRHLDCLGFTPQYFSADDLIKFYEIVKSHNGIFCLATHYREINTNAKETLQRLVSYVYNDPEGKFVLASSILINFTNRRDCKVKKNVGKN